MRGFNSRGLNCIADVLRPCVVDLLVTKKRCDTENVSGECNVTMMLVEIKVVGAGQGIFLGIEVAPVDLFNEIFYVELSRIEVIPALA